MNIYILTIPDQAHRVWVQLGHLEHKGFPVEDFDRINICNGFNFLDFGNARDVYKAMVEDGFVDLSDMASLPYYKQESKENHHAVVVQHGFYKILQQVEKSGEPALVLENDAYFPDLNWETLLEKWDQLRRVVGYENINIVQLFWRIKHRKDNEVIDDFWVRGSRSGGQVANIYTPQGVRYMFENKNPATPIEVWLAEAADSKTDIPGVFSSKYRQVRLTFACFDSPHYVRHAGRTPDDWFNHYKGEQL